MGGYLRSSDAKAREVIRQALNEKQNELAEIDQYLKGKLSPENELRAEEFSNRVILYGNEER